MVPAPRSCSLHSVNLVVYVQCALGVIPAWLAFGLASGPGERNGGVVAFVSGVRLHCRAPCADLSALHPSRTVSGSSWPLPPLFLCVRVIDGSERATAYAALAPVRRFGRFVALPRRRRAWRLLFAYSCWSLYCFCSTGTIAGGAASLRRLARPVPGSFFRTTRSRIRAVPGYNAASGRFMLAAVLPIVSRDGRRTLHRPGSDILNF